MRTSQYRGLARVVQQQTVGLILQRLRPADFSARCTAWVLWSCLVLAAACRRSLAAVAALWSGAPSRETLRQALRATLPAYPDLLQHVPGLLRASWPRGLRKRRSPLWRYPLIVDLHAVPYFKRCC